MVFVYSICVCLFLIFVCILFYCSPYIENQAILGHGKIAEWATFIFLHWCCYLFIESQQTNVKKMSLGVGTYNYAGLFSEIFLGKQKDPIHSVAPLSPFKFKKYFTCNKFLLITKLINRSIYFGFNILKKNFRGHDVFQFNINALIFII